jgi:hypothetical protein
MIIYLLLLLVGGFTGFLLSSIYNIMSLDYYRYKKYSLKLNEFIKKDASAFIFNKRLNSFFYFRLEIAQNLFTNIAIKFEDNKYELLIDNIAYNTDISAYKVAEFCDKLLLSFKKEAFEDVTNVNGFIYSNNYLKEYHPDHYKYYNNVPDDVEVSSEPNYDVDEILDKISEKGMGSLTKGELKFLKNHK